MAQIVQKNYSETDVTIPSIPGLTQKVKFDGENLIEEIREVSAGTEHTLILINNDIYGSGWNLSKQILDSEDNNILNFTLIPKGEIGNEKIISVKAGSGFSAALTETGRVFVWGSDEEIFGSGVEDQLILFPKLIKGLKRIVEIDCGDFHIVARTKTGDTYILGDEGNGAFPLTRLNLSPAVQVCAKGHHSAILDTFGKVFVWGQKEIREFEGPINKIALGKNKLFMLAGTKLFTYNIKTKIIKEKDIRYQVNSILAGSDFYLMVIPTEDGNTYIRASGINAFGKLGLGQKDYSFVGEDEEVLIPTLTIESISCGLDHSIAVDSEGRIFTWGLGGDGQLGTGRFEDEILPVEVEF